jgi:hypothetical protein
MACAWWRASIIFALIVMMQAVGRGLAMVQVIGVYALILGTTEVLLAFESVRGGASAGLECPNLPIAGGVRMVGLKIKKHRLERNPGRLCARGGTRAPQPLNEAASIPHNYAASSA